MISGLCSASHTHKIEFVLCVSETGEGCSAIQGGMHAAEQHDRSVEQTANHMPLYCL